MTLEERAMVKDVDAYIESAPAPQQAILRQLRELVREAAPSAVEKLAYGMPSYLCGRKRLLHFASAARHVGVYGLVHVDGEVPAELQGFLDHRSTLRFPVHRPLPATAIRDAIRRKAHDLEPAPRS
jgi:uncharacterized protein YdhG (YjbR/CyaY superfamily)